MLNAAAKSLQSCPTLCDPIDGSPSGSAVLEFSKQEHWSRLPNRYSYMHGPGMGIIPNKLNSYCLLRAYRLKHIISQLLTWRVPVDILILFRITK